MVNCNYCCKHSQPLSLIHDDELYLVIQGSASENDILKSYNLIYSMENTQSIYTANVVGHATCKILYCNNRILLLSGQFDNGTITWKLRLYQQDVTSYRVSWKQISCFSGLQLDLKNSIPVSYGNDGIILASVVQNQEMRQTTISLVIYMFPQFRGSGEKNWKAVKVRLRAAKCEIQSCVVISNCIYCSILLHGTGAYIYQCDFVTSETKSNK